MPLLIILGVLVTIIFISYLYVITHPAHLHTTLSPSKLDEIQKKKAITRVQLRHGWTRYNFFKSPTAGAATKPLVICLHGIQSNSFVWEKLVSKMQVKEGCDILTFDCYGRGFSDAPHTKYNVDFYCGQIDDLLTELKLQDRKLYLIGHSMGGAIATAYTSRNINRVEKLVLLAPAGLPVSPLSQAAINLCKMLPFFSDALFYSILTMLVQKPPIRAFYNPDQHKGSIDILHQNMVQQLQFNPGFVRAYLATMRHFPLSNLVESYKILGKSSIPILVLWGDKDKVIPVHNTKSLGVFVPHAQIKILNETGHQLVLEQQDRVSDEVLSFYKQ